MDRKSDEVQNDVIELVDPIFGRVNFVGIYLLNVNLVTVLARTSL